MEQLSRREIDGLISRSRTGETGTQGLAGLWSRRTTPDALPVCNEAGDRLDIERLDAPLPVAPLHVTMPPEGDASQLSRQQPCGLSVSPAQATPMAGLERRLARRAEALWETLRGGAAMPPAAAAALFLAPPFAAHALLFSMPLPTAGAQAGGMRIGYVGEAVAKLDIVAPDAALLNDGPEAALGVRLAAVAARAIETGSPTVFDSEEQVIRTGTRGRPPLLMRAMAFPLAASADSGPAAIVIASWRELLSPDETDALHRELAAAIDWMHHHKPQD